MEKINFIPSTNHSNDNIFKDSKIDGYAGVSLGTCAPDSVSWEGNTCFGGNCGSSCAGFGCAG